MPAWVKYIYRMYGWFLRLVGGMDGFIKRPAAAFWPEALVISGWWSTTDDHCLHGCRISDQWDDVWDDTVRALAEWFANRRAALHWWDWLHLAAQHVDISEFLLQESRVYICFQADRHWRIDARRTDIPGVSRWLQPLPENGQLGPISSLLVKNIVCLKDVVLEPFVCKDVIGGKQFWAKYYLASTLCFELKCRIWFLIFDWTLVLVFVLVFVFWLIKTLLCRPWLDLVLFSAFDWSLVKLLPNRRLTVVSAFSLLSAVRACGAGQR